MVQRLHRDEIVPRGKSGKKGFKPTAKQRLTVMAAAEHLTQEEICLLVRDKYTNEPIGVETLVAHFKEELVAGGAVSALEIGNRLVKSAKRGDMKAIRWYEITRRGKKEVVRNEMTGKDGQPLPTERTIVVLPSNGRETGGREEYSEEPKHKRANGHANGKGNGHKRP